MAVTGHGTILYTTFSGIGTVLLYWCRHGFPLPRKLHAITMAFWYAASDKHGNETLIYLHDLHCMGSLLSSI